METIVHQDNPQYKYKIIKGISKIKGGVCVLKNLNYKTLLKSTNNLNNKNTNFNQINRFMPTSKNIENTIKKLYFEKILNG